MTTFDYMTVYGYTEVGQFYQKQSSQGTFDAKRYNSKLIYFYRRVFPDTQLVRLSCSVSSLGENGVGRACWLCLSGK